MMLLARLVPPGVVAALLLLGGMWAAANFTGRAPESSVMSANLAPVPVREGLILISMQDPEKRDQPAILFTTEGKEVGRFAVGAAAQPVNPGGPPSCSLFHARLSPDGKRLAAFKIGPIKQDNVGPWVPLHLWMFALDDKKGPTEALRSNMRNPSLAWDPDGSKLFVSEVNPENGTDPVEKGKLPAMISWVHDVKTKKNSLLALPAGHEIIDVSSDGKSLLTRTRPSQEWDSETGHVIALETLKSRRLSGQPFQAMRFSPDAKEVIGYRHGKKEDRPSPGVLVIMPVTEGRERTIALPPTATHSAHACWSPDGKRIAYEWTEIDAAAPEENGQPAPQGKMRPNLPLSRVSVADFDGNRSKVILRCEQGQTIRGIDWR